MADDASWTRAFDSGATATEDAPAAPPARQRRRRRGSRGARKRADIQGLRMLAVVPVVINHLTGHPRGGFVGVDVFFVISGYLITGLLIRDASSSGAHFGGYVVNFYRRRVRRLFPAALLVIVLGIAFSAVVFTAARFQSTVQSGGWAAVFWSNWHSIALGSDYFSAGLPDSPFQHYWSLSVEEQFYVVWPLIVYGVTALALRAGLGQDRRRTALAAAAGVLSLASLAFAWHQSGSDPTVAYFSTFDRGWELGLGAVLACFAPRLRGGRRLMTALSWTGTAMILVSLWVAHGGAGFPVPGALLPCVGAALVIAARSPQAEAFNPLLTNRVSVLVGDISYSVYLVHFPVIVLLAAYMKTHDGYFYSAAVLLTVGLSVALYALVERPVLESRFLLGGPRKAPERADTELPTQRLATGAAAFAVAALAVLTLWPGAEAGQAQKLQQVEQALGSGQGDDPSAGPAQQQLTGELRAALLARSWPTLNPPLDHPRKGVAAKAGCAIELATPQQCTWGDRNAAHTAYLVGDSTSTFYDDGFIKVFENLPGWKVRVAGGSACAFADVNLNANTNDPKVRACPQRNVDLVKELKQAKPDLVFVTTINGAPKTNTHVENELDKVRGDIGKIVVLPAPPPGDDPQACYTKGSVPSDCESAAPNYYAGWMANEQTMARQLDGAFIDNTDWFCVKGYCPMFAAHVPMRFDADHITPQYGTLLAPVIRESIEDAKLLDVH